MLWHDLKLNIHSGKSSSVKKKNQWFEHITFRVDCFFSTCSTVISSCLHNDNIEYLILTPNTIPGPRGGAVSYLFNLSYQQSSHCLQPLKNVYMDHDNIFLFCNFKKKTYGETLFLYNIKLLKIHTHILNKVNNHINVKYSEKKEIN